VAVYHRSSGVDALGSLELQTTPATDPDRVDAPAGHLRPQPTVDEAGDRPVVDVVPVGFRRRSDLGDGDERVAAAAAVTRAEPEDQWTPTEVGDRRRRHHGSGHQPPSDATDVAGTVASVGNR
jgi:hypothetical protein